MAAPIRVGVPAGDPSREYTHEEQERLTLNLARLTSAVHRGDFGRAGLTTELLAALHFNIFTGVRNHAGRFRRSDFGQEHLTFGPIRSPHRDEVPDLLEQAFSTAREQLFHLEAGQDAPGHELACVRLATLLHAEVIRIHPFEDGNGRAARELMNVLMVRLGLLPVALEAPKQEYITCLNQYHTARDIEPLIDLVLDLYG